MILLTLKNGIPVSWETYRNELALAKAIKKRSDKVLTYGQLALAKVEGKYRISQNLWILSDRHNDQDKDLEEHYLHEES